MAHEDLRLPPYGGGLFDPDRYPWLEGVDGDPPPVDDLTVLRMLTAVRPRCALRSPSSKVATAPTLPA